ncbi:hypothetical protein I0C86_27800 [Plantactinospora sp. S1510]|uniref:Uncharacterized protein n=1 Tax=Plantactinospora alkalitolerans TaxID=2789879 RepID=A0ABS0H2P0_9ACTN|nr:hypothetical protein [Plantactinospora alkalitolerans]MBF9132731.1 hypothetical protein [Plantactinospora alkalitolerans]
MDWTAGWAVQRTWPDRTPDVFGFGRRGAVARRRLHRDRRYWGTGPLHPTGYALVATSWFDVQLHPQPCASAACSARVEVTW